MELFIVFLLGIMLGVVGLFIFRPSLLVKPTQDFSLLEDLAEELMGQIEQKEAELDAKYDEIMAAVNQSEQRLLKLSDDIVKALKSGNLSSPKVKAVLELKEQGCDEMTIAKRLGMGVGEVQLILSLNDSIST